nr:RNA polymerase II-associated protein 3 isoform X1 [Tanacetum cinerariifolium]
MDFEGFLNNLQDWELSLKDKDKKPKSQSVSDKMGLPLKLKYADNNFFELGVNGSLCATKQSWTENSQKIRVVGVERRNMDKYTTVHSSVSREKDYLKKYDAAGHLSSSFISNDSSVDANSKKEAMAYLKLRRFLEAEDDCTEALNLDDRYIKAYSDSDYAGASLDRKSTTGGCQFLGCEMISWQYKKQTLIATSSTEAEYVAAASCCAQVLWIQNQLLDYGWSDEGVLKDMFPRVYALESCKNITIADK